MTVSVFTPSHDSRWLDECYDSLRAQTHEDWEWVVLLNNGAEWAPSEDDERVRTFHQGAVKGVGAAKSEAVKLTTGSILVELDHDDVLDKDCLAEVVATFDANPGAGLVWSDFTQVNADGLPNTDRFDPAHGWTYRDEQPYIVADGMDATLPHNVGYVWYAPNHVRAFSRKAYDAAGGYDAARVICDDHDLLTRLFCVGEFVHVPKCLYYQRVGVGNTQSGDLNALIQSETVKVYDERIESMMLAWSGRRGLACLDLGSAHGKAAGYTGIDLVPGPTVDLAGDVFDVLATLPDDSVGLVRAADFLEHLPDKIRIWNELHRVLVHGGMVLSVTPSTDGRGAWQDPTHLVGYNEHSFWYLGYEQYRRYVSTHYVGRWHLSRLFTTDHPTIPYVVANLVALKEGGSRLGGVE